MTYVNDTDLEVRDLAELAEYLDAETCAHCGEVGASITLERRPGREAYECICGHVSTWINGKRVS